MFYKSFGIRLAKEILEPARKIIKGDIIITSGFRCAELNALAGGAEKSEHLFGRAADFVPFDMGVEEAFHLLKNEPGFEYGQLIFETGGGKRWLHISLPSEKHKNQAFSLSM